MIWIILNIVLLVIGICLIAASRYASSVSAYKDLPEDIFDIQEVLLYCYGIIFLSFFLLSLSRLDGGWDEC